MTPAEIREARRKTGLNTAAFGALLGVSGRTVEGWEQGRRKVPATVVRMLPLIIYEGKPIL